MSNIVLASFGVIPSVTNFAVTANTDTIMHETTTSFDRGSTNVLNGVPGDVFLQLELQSDLSQSSGVLFSISCTSASNAALTSSTSHRVAIPFNLDIQGFAKNSLFTSRRFSLDDRYYGIRILSNTAYAANAFPGQFRAYLMFAGRSLSADIPRPIIVTL